MYLKKIFSYNSLNKITYYLSRSINRKDRSQQNKIIKANNSFQQSLQTLFKVSSLEIPNSQITINQQQLQKLRILQQQQLIKDIPNFDNLWYILQQKKKISLQLRKWDQLKLNIKNQIQILKYTSNRINNIKAANRQYCQLCVSYMMNDHNNLQQLLSFLWNKKNKQIQQYGYGKFRQSKLKVINGQHDEQNLRNIYYQSVGCLVLGYHEEAIQLIYLLLNMKQNSQYKQKGFILLITYLSYMNSNKKLNHKDLLTLLKTQKINKNQFMSIIQYSIDTNTSLYIVKTLIKQFRKKQYTDIHHQDMIIYGKILCLICQNTYLQDKKQQAKQIMKFLSSFQCKYTRIYLKYIQIGFLFDEQQYQKIIYIYENLGLKNGAEKYFNNSNKTEKSLNQNDFLIIQILKICQKTFKILNNKEIAQQIEQQISILECYIGCFTSKIIQIQQKDEQTILLDKPKRTKIPYHNFNLQLQNIFHQKYLHE